MADAEKPGVPAWYWAVAILALLWTLMGCFAYLSQVMMSPAEMAKLPQEQQDIWEAMPGWVTALYALAVWMGLAGAVCLLLRREFAETLFFTSLAAAIIQFGWVFLATDILRTIGPSSTLFPLFIIVVGAALVWFARMAKTRGWIR